MNAVILNLFQDLFMIWARFKVFQAMSDQKAWKMLDLRLLRGWQVQHNNLVVQY